MLAYKWEHSHKWQCSLAIENRSVSGLSVAAKFLDPADGMCPQLLSCVWFFETPWYPSRPLCPRDFPGKNTGVGCPFFPCLFFHFHFLFTYLCFRFFVYFQNYSPCLYVTSNLVFFFFFLVWLHQVLVLACEVFSCSIQTLSCGLWDLVSWPGLEPWATGLESMES